MKMDFLISPRVGCASNEHQPLLKGNDHKGFGVGAVFLRINLESGHTDDRELGLMILKGLTGRTDE